MSWLKKAYESIEGEISRTFDSSQQTSSSGRQLEPSPVTAATAQDVEERDSTSEDVSVRKKAVGEREEGEENWGDWEEQNGGRKPVATTTAERAMQPSSDQQREKGTPPPPPVSDAAAGTGAPSPVASSTPAKPGSKLDTMPRTELVKYIRKQAQLLQKTKSRCDELVKECNQLKQPPPVQQSNTEGLMEELQVVRSERDRAMADQRELQQTISGLQQENQGLNEEKQSLATELKQLQSVGEDLRCRVEVSATQLAAQQQEHEEKRQRLTAQLAEAEKRVLSLTDTQQEKKELEDEVERLRDRERELEREIERLNERVREGESELKSVMCDVERVRSEAEEAVRKVTEDVACEREKMSKLREELEELRGERETAGKHVVAELTEKIENLTSQLESVVSERDELVRVRGTAESEREQVASQLTAVQEELCEREKEIEDLRKQLEESRQSIRHLEEEGETRPEEGEGEREGLHQAAAVEEEREREVSQLRAEMERLQRQREEAEKKLETVASERAAAEQSLTQQSEAHREETKKLKAYIVKMKKELTEARDKMAAHSTSSEEKTELQKQLDETRVALGAGQQSLEKCQRERQEAEEAVLNLKKELESLHTERDGLQSSLAAATEELSVIRSELSTSQSDLATVQTQVGGAQRATEVAEKEAESLREELAREREGHSATKQKLAAAVKEAKVTNVMNLELEDYQRSIQALNEKLAEAQRELEGARGEGRKQQDTVESMRKQMDLKTQQSIAMEDRLSKTKALWMKTKKELDAARKTEGELQMAMATLTAQLEGEKQASEQSKVDMAALTAKLQSMQQQSDSSVGVLQKTVRTLEHKLAAALNELTSSQLALSQCQQDYNNYKIRVHSVLKQKNSGPSAAEISTEIQQKFETEIAQLKAELQESKSQLSSALTELDEVSEEHQELASRHQQLLSDSQSQLTASRKQLEEAESRHTRAGREQAEVISQLRQEVVEVTETFRAQLQRLQEEQQRVVASLNSELETARDSLTRLQQEADARVLARASSQSENTLNHAHSSGSTHLNRQAISQEPRLAESALPTEQRGTGEGMDQSELESLPQTPLSREDSHLSLQRLLSTTDSDNSLLPPASLSRTKLPTSATDQLQLRGELARTKKTIRDLTELLRESEEAGVRFGEQAKLLKEEIRRLERNREREEGVSNMEYLKNVVLKFLHSEDGGEREALIPVITQLLRLSPQEIHFLQDTIRGAPATLPDASSTLPSPSAHKGLAGYIHRWTGY